MIFFVGSAMADGAASSGGGLMSFLPMVLFIGIIYFLLIRPQQKRTKQHQALVSAIKKGDKVVTNSGIIGTIAKVLNDQEVLIEISDKIFVKFVKSTIASVVNPTAPASAVSVSTPTTEQNTTEVETGPILKKEKVVASIQKKNQKNVKQSVTKKPKK
ncbi:MAG: preprotein translocase subunit YajC [Holosporales bacterium]|jgi:preprotein translocase subunit YajC|nr:preprotein translocase subunit YajC [Holosporales bacterium]